MKHNLLNMQLKVRLSAPQISPEYKSALLALIRLYLCFAAAVTSDPRTLPGGQPQADVPPLNRPKRPSRPVLPQPRLTSSNGRRRLPAAIQSGAGPTAGPGRAGPPPEGEGEGGLQRPDGQGTARPASGSARHRVSVPVSILRDYRGGEAPGGAAPRFICVWDIDMPCLRRRILCRTRWICLRGSRCTWSSFINRDCIDAFLGGQASLGSDSLARKVSN